LAQNISSSRAEAQQVCDAEPCAYCRSEECLELVKAQQALAAGERKLELLAKLSSDNATRCWECALPRGTLMSGTAVEWSCASLCVPLWALEENAPAVVREANDWIGAYAKGNLEVKRGAALGEAMHACVSPEDVATLQVIVRTAAARAPWELLLGFRIALSALATLLPTIFALMSGTVRGAMIAKFVIPYSRIPALILTCAISYTLPVLMMLLVVVKCLIGDATLMPTIICLLASLIVFLPWQMLWGRKIRGASDLAVPQHHAEAEKAIALRQYLQIFFQIGLVVMFMLWLTQWAPFLVQLGKSGLLPINVGMFRGAVFTVEFWGTLGFTTLTLIFNFFGISRIAGVCFADAVLYAVMLVDEANVAANAMSVDTVALLSGDRVADDVSAQVALFAELHKGLLCQEPDLHRRVLCTACRQSEDMEANLPRFRIVRGSTAEE